MTFEVHHILKSASDVMIVKFSPFFCCCLVFVFSSLPKFENDKDLIKGSNFVLIEEDSFEIFGIVL